MLSEPSNIFDNLLDVVPPPPDDGDKLDHYLGGSLSQSCSCSMSWQPTAPRTRCSRGRRHRQRASPCGHSKCAGRGVDCLAYPWSPHTPCGGPTPASPRATISLTSSLLVSRSKEHGGVTREGSISDLHGDGMVDEVLKVALLTEDGVHERCP